MSITKLINGSALTFGTISLVGAAAFLGANPAQATGFSGSYDPSNWTLTNTNADGSVNTSNSPNSITVTGGDNGSGGFGSTAYTTTAAATGLVSFDWNYSTQDPPAFWDPFGFLLNGVFTQLTNDNLVNQSGAYTTSVNAGDVFGFVVNTRDNVFGRGNVTISNFTAPQPVPEPASVLGLLSVAALGVGSKFKRNLKQNSGDNHLN